jgi:hypothetical protein
MGCVAFSSSGSSREQMEEVTDSWSSESDSPRHVSVISESSPMILQSTESTAHELQSLTPFSYSGDGLRRSMLRGRKHLSRTHAVIVVGAPG